MAGPFLNLLPESRRAGARRAVHTYERVVVAKTDAIEMEGTVTEVLPSAMFRVTVQGGHDVLATLGGKMRQHRIRVLAGDLVKIEVSPYDLSRGRITYRHK